jgi:hypothetical protein
MTKGQKQGVFAILGIIFIFSGLLSVDESRQMDRLSYHYFDEGGLTFQHYRDEVSLYSNISLILFVLALVCVFMVFAAKDKTQNHN